MAWSGAYFAAAAGGRTTGDERAAAPHDAGGISARGRWRDRYSRHQSCREPRVAVSEDRSAASSTAFADFTPDNGAPMVHARADFERRDAGRHPSPSTEPSSLSSLFDWRQTSLQLVEETLGESTSGICVTSCCKNRLIGPSPASARIYFGSRGKILSCQERSLEVCGLSTGRPET
jgi:hypothetical protein